MYCSCYAWSSSAEIEAEQGEVAAAARLSAAALLLARGTGPVAALNSTAAAPRL